MDVWAEYDHWNEAIAEIIFARSDEARPVYLDLEEDLVDELAERVGVEPGAAAETMCDVVGQTLRRTDGPASVFGRHDQRLRSWVRTGRSTPPPTLTVLATFSLAAEQMAGGDGMAANNYFGRLRQVLRWKSGDPALDIAYRRVAERYWDELNRWLIQEEGHRGLPTAYSLAHRFVGLSVSQALVRSSDREKLKDFFQVFGFAPGSQVAPADLVPLMDSWIKQTHCPVTASLARLWGNAQARPRIAEAAAITLASWDGGVRARDNSGEPATGRLLLTLELGGFPRKRFAISALLYVPDPQVGRTAQVLTAVPQATIEIVPDVPGALGLAPGSSLHASDVLAGVLRVQDSRSGLTVERRPRRLAAFREDELTRRWVEVQQVMLGDDLRLLVEAGLVERVSEILTAVARPGWTVADPYPGQPEGWTLFTGVEVLNRPRLADPRGQDGRPVRPHPPDIVDTRGVGGFAIPGSVRGKWHAAVPPELLAVAVKRRLRRAADRAGSLQRGRDRARIWPAGRTGEQASSPSPFATCSCTTATTGPSLFPLARRIDGKHDDLPPIERTPDERQWHLAESLAYGPGVGVLGLPTDTKQASVQGHATMHANGGTAMSVSEVPAAPTWSKDVGTRQRPPAPMRLTVPDADSCIRTGRHRQDIETVESTPEDAPPCLGATAAAGPVVSSSATRPA